MKYEIEQTPATSRKNRLKELRDTVRENLEAAEENGYREWMESVTPHKIASEMIEMTDMADEFQDCPADPDHDLSNLVAFYVAEWLRVKR